MSLELERDVIVEAALPDGLAASTIENMIGPVLSAAGAAGRWTVVVVLTNDTHLQELHRDFMGIDEPTDVMTFPYDEPEAPVEQHGGDIVVSVERAKAQAPDFGLTPAQETIFLVSHGLLHLCGWDDASPEARGAMLDRQREILTSLGLLG